MSNDDTFRSWMADLETIKQNVFELFSARRTFRDVAEVFKRNPRLADTGWHLWEWMLLNYIAAVLMRIRRLVDSQRGTVNLKQLLHAIIAQPDVITRGRRYEIHGPIEFQPVREMVDRSFTEIWVRNPSDNDPAGDRVDPAIVEADLAALEDQLEKVTAFANRAIAHKTRVAPGNITYAEIDAAFAAIEAMLKKYHTLIHGGSLMQAEPAPQFNTHEVFTFPWMETMEGPD